FFFLPAPGRVAIGRRAVRGAALSRLGAVAAGGPARAGSVNGAEGMIRAAVPRTAGRAAVRLAIGFLIGAAFWAALSPPYERTLAAGAETLLRWTEWPAVTRLEARRGEILIAPADFPPAAPRPAPPRA